MTQPKSFKNERFFKGKWRQNTGFIQVCTKTKPTLRRLHSLGLNKGMMECRFLLVGLRDVNPWGSCTPWNLQRLHQHQLHTPTSHPCLYCTLKGTFIHLSASPARQPKLFLIKTKPGGWGAHNQSLVRLMIILKAPWKRGTPSEWLVPRWNCLFLPQMLGFCSSWLGLPH